MDLKLVVLLLTFIAAQSAPVEDESTAEVTRYEFRPNSGDGSYQFQYRTSNGIEREETGTVKRNKDNEEYIAVEGYYTYYTDKGKITVNYEADEEGYRQTIQEDLPVGLPGPLIGSLVGGGLG